MKDTWWVCLTPAVVLRSNCRQNAPELELHRRACAAVPLSLARVDFYTDILKYPFQSVSQIPFLSLFDDFLKDTLKSTIESDIIKGNKFKNFFFHLSLLYILVNIDKNKSKFLMGIYYWTIWHRLSSFINFEVQGTPRTVFKHDPFFWFQMRNPCRLSFSRVFHK